MEPELEGFEVISPKGDLRLARAAGSLPCRALASLSGVVKPCNRTCPRPSLHTLLASLSTSGSSARLRLSGDLRHSSGGSEYLLHSLATLANMLRLLTRAYLAALLSSLGSASIYPTNPIASTVLGAGRVNTIQWIDDGKWPTLDAMGPVKIDLYVGEVSTLFLRQLPLLARPPVPRKRVVSKV